MKGAGFLWAGVLSCCMVTGCMRFDPKRGGAETTLSPRQKEIPVEEIQETLSCPSTKSDLLQSIETYEKLAAADSSHYPALVTLSHLYLLLGDGYAENTASKKTSFSRALYYSEQAMLTNPDFKAKTQKGEDIWDATRALSPREMEAMLFWTTAVFYYYKDCLSPMGQVVNFRWIKRARQVLEEMTRIDADFGGGAVYLTWGFYYLSIPESVGGDRGKSKEYFARAVATGPDWALHRWARAKYFHVKMKNKEGFIRDLTWVLEQKVEELKDHCAWIAFYRQDAKRLLGKTEEYFKE